MTKFIALAAILFTFNAVAHVTPGKYTGHDQNNKACSFTVGEVWFEDDFAHPLNERLPVTHITFNDKVVEEVIWNLGHPPVVNTTVGTNRYNHDIFQQIVPSKVGAVSVTLLKADEKENEKEEEQPPVGIIYVIDNYRSKADSVKWTCLL